MSEFQIQVVVDGKQETYDPTKPVDDIAALLARWGYILAAWQHEASVKDAAYRMWKAKQAKVLLDADPKLAEWKVQAEIESSPEWGKFKAAIADAQRCVSLCWSVLEALRARAAQNQRNEGEAKGAPSASAPAGEGSQPPPARRKAVR